MKRTVLVGCLILILLASSGAQSVHGKIMFATCSGTGCNGKYPGPIEPASDCYLTAITLATKAISYGYNDLRKSTECNTYWARTMHTSATPHYVNATLKYYYYEGSKWYIPQYGQMYTKQRYAGSGYQACGLIGDTIMDYYYPENCTTPKP